MSLLVVIAVSAEQGLRELATEEDVRLEARGASCLFGNASSTGKET